MCLALRGFTLVKRAVGGVALMFSLQKQALVGSLRFLVQKRPLALTIQA